MADYYPLVARAVAGLTTNTGDVRRALYERARTALVTQLRSSNPPLSENDITHERLALEEAIRKVEATAARRPRDLLLEADAQNDGPPAAGRDEAETSAPPPATGDAPPQDAASGNLHGTLGEAADLGRASSRSARAARDNYDALSGSGTPGQVGGVIPADAPPPPPPADLSGRRGTSRTASFDDDLDETYRKPARSYTGLIRAAVVLIAVLAVASILYWQRNNIVSAFKSFRSQPVQTARDTAPAGGAKPKIADRIGAGADQRGGTAPATDVAQKVVLYEEDAANPQGKRYVGSAQWRTETVSPGPGLAPELAIRADVEIPERRIRMTWSLRRNADKALPASHTIEIMFAVPADFSEGGVANVPGVLMKSGEQTRGTPLAGLAVKVTAGFFLIGLSAVETDLQRNLQLLKERPWFDIPIVYNNGKRAILAVEKGPAGERVFEDAMRAWGE